MGDAGNQVPSHVPPSETAPSQPAQHAPTSEDHPGMKRVVIDKHKVYEFFEPIDEENEAPSRQPSQQQTAPPPRQQLVPQQTVQSAQEPNQWPSHDSHHSHHSHHSTHDKAEGNQGRPETAPPPKPQ